MMEKKQTQVRKRTTTSGNIQTNTLLSQKKGRKKHQSQPSFLKAGNRKKKRSRSFVKEISLSVLLGLVLSVLLASFFFTLVTVRGFSMSPTLRDGNVLLVRKTDRLQRFDLAVFSRGENTHVRRVIGLPGDKLQYKDDTLFINNQPLDEKFLVEKVNQSQKNGKNFTEDFSLSMLGEMTVIPDDCYLFLGDNRPYSTDSRHYGLVKEEQIIGIAKVKFLPLNQLQGF